MTQNDIIRIIEEENVAFVRLQFTDIFGGLKNISVSVGQIYKVLQNKFCFDGDAVFDGKHEIEDKLFLCPDLDTFVILPWRPQDGKVARLICDICYEDGTPFELSPRFILQRTVRMAAQKGYSFMVDPECEFFMFHTDEYGRPTTTTHETAGYLDAGPSDLGENATREIVMMLDDIGFEIESCHHELAPGQHEIDFPAEDSMKIADTIQTFRYAVRSITKRFGLHATFMPKPVAGVAGSGMHLNLIVSRDGKDLFRTPEGEVTPETYRFIAGIMAHAKGLAAIANPIVNSYKRLLSGYQAPSRITWSSRGWNALLKVKKYRNSVKIEVRFPDGASNAYLVMAALIAAGIDGIERGLDAGPDSSENKEILEHAEPMPQSLKEAVDQLSCDETLRKVLGEEFTDVYTQLKNAEWNDYMRYVSDWELRNYLAKM